MSPWWERAKKHWVGIVVVAMIVVVSGRFLFVTIWPAIEEDFTKYRSRFRCLGERYDPEWEKLDDYRPESKSPTGASHVFRSREEYNPAFGNEIKQVLAADSIGVIRGMRPMYWSIESELTEGDGGRDYYLSIGDGGETLVGVDLAFVYYMEFGKDERIVTLTVIETCKEQSRKSRILYTLTPDSLALVDE